MSSIATDRLGQALREALLAVASERDRQALDCPYGCLTAASIASSAPADGLALVLEVLAIATRETIVWRRHVFNPTVADLLDQRARFGEDQEQ